MTTIPTRIVTEVMNVDSSTSPRISAVKPGVIAVMGAKNTMHSTTLTSAGAGSSSQAPSAKSTA